MCNFSGDWIHSVKNSYGLVQPFVFVTKYFPLIFTPLGGNTRATGMLLQYKVPGSDELKQIKFAAGEDFSSNKKLSATWLAAMHKVTKAIVN